MKGDVRLYSISVIGAYLPFFEELRKQIATYPLPFSGWKNCARRTYLPFFEELRKQIATYPLPFSGWKNCARRTTDSSAISP